MTLTDINPVFKVTARSQISKKNGVS